MAIISWNDYVIGDVTVNLSLNFTFTRTSATTGTLAVAWSATIPNGDDSRHVLAWPAAESIYTTIKGFDEGNFSYSGTASRNITGLNASGGRLTIPVYFYRTTENWSEIGTSSTQNLVIDYADMTAPTVTASVQQAQSSRVTFTASANANCNLWQYKIASGEWQTFSSDNGTSAGATISVANGNHTLTIRAKKTVNALYGTSSALSVDMTAPTVRLSIADIDVDSIGISITAGESCDRWEYSINGGATWSLASSTTGSGTRSFTITGLEPNRNYSIVARARKASNLLYGLSQSFIIKTLGGATYVSTGSGFKKAIAYVSDGTRYKIAIPYVYTLDGWKQTKF